MLKSQILIVIASLFLVILIFQLPKVIVSNDKSAKDTPYVDSSDHSDHEDAHKVILSPDDLEYVNSLRRSYNSFSDMEKRIIFADSLGNFFRANFIFDSAAIYFNEIAKQRPTKEYYLKAADAYADASVFASGESKIKYNSLAGDLYNKALSIDPADNNVKAKLAMTLVVTETPMQGISMLKDILEKDPANESALYNLGVLSMQTGQYDKAIERFNNLLKVNPANANGHFYLGMCFAGINNKAKALESLNRARSLTDDPAFHATVDSYIKELNK